MNTKIYDKMIFHHIFITIQVLAMKILWKMNFGNNNILDKIHFIMHL